MGKESSGVSVCEVPTNDLSQTDESSTSGLFTQEFLAKFIADKEAGKKVSHPQEHTFHDLLYNSIYRFVVKTCTHYLADLGSDLEDAVQDCMISIFRRIQKFDSTRGCFSTFSGWVCLTVLNSKHRRKLRQRIYFVDNYSSFENVPAPNLAPSPVAMDIADAVNDLVKSHPKRRRLIFEMFGKPKENGLCFPTKIIVARAARAARVDASDAYYFYSKIVRPFFQKRFEQGD